jgi:hypothetical protein
MAIGRETGIVDAVGIEHRAIHLIQTILEWFRGQVSMRTRPKSMSKTRCRTFL